MMQDERIRKGNQTIIQSFFGWWIGVAVIFVILKYFFGNQFWLESLPEWVVIIISSLVIGITQFLKHQNEVVDERLEEEIGKWYRWSFYAMIILSIIAYMIQVVMTTN
ncbi:MAG: hypothetical protein PHP32_04385 [Candidatus Izemoplasmatales bacterium]|nr:hypothetical protein [Candidatus Izemoplasmatales bacterium]